MLFSEYDEHDLRSRINEDNEYLANQRNNKGDLFNRVSANSDEIIPTAPPHQPNEVRKRQSRKAAAAANAAITASSSETSTSSSKLLNYKSTEVILFSRLFHKKLI